MTNDRPSARGWMRAGLLALFVTYLVVLYDLAIFHFPASHPPPNLVPFRSIVADWRFGGRNLLVNFVGNLVAFLPMGMVPALDREETDRAGTCRRVLSRPQPGDRGLAVFFRTPGRRRGRPDPQHGGRAAGLRDRPLLARRATNEPGRDVTNRQALAVHLDSGSRLLLRWTVHHQREGFPGPNREHSWRC